MKVVAQNKKAYREYQILEKFEAGISLRGTEVKSLRAGNIQLVDAYVHIIEDEAYLAKMNIAEYAMGSWNNHRPTRRRKLLLHKREIRKLKAQTDERGLTIVPLRIYLNDKGLFKVEIGVGRGRKLHDKRAEMKKRDAERSIQRAMRRED